MNREIKFRVWDTTNQDGPEMVSLNFGEGFSGMNDCPIMQYTGRKDMNKKEICEGDIVKADDYKDKTWVIEYRTDTEYVGFVLNEVGKQHISYFVSWKLVKVVGNICENPELLNS